MFSVEEVRKDFPILNSGLIYFDNAASSLTPEPVIQKMLEFYRCYRANIERSVHKLSQKASREFEEARIKITKFINANSEKEVIITKNTTEGINLIANGINWQKGDKIVTTLIEHHSNFIVWLKLKRKFGVDVKIIKPNKEGKFNIKDFEEALDEKTKLLSITHVSNVLGSITPVKELTKIAHKVKAKVLIDGAQSTPHIPIDVKEIGCDFFVFSGHKMLGPTGIGILYIKEEHLNDVEPPFIGGGTISEVSSSDYILNESPMRFEAGTPPIAEVIGLGAAIDYLSKIGLKNIEAYEKKLIEKMDSELRKIDKVEVYGPKEFTEKIGLTSFNVKGLTPHDVALTLDASANIMVRSGHHCAMPLTKELLGLSEGSVRASLYLYNTMEEVEKFLSIIEEIAKSLA
ncbi:MAG: cysteine desulfurase [Candidatus Bathyarchaeia archaeon]|nr:cysteine desulfurase [Candidatus Bathyarchaeota archaeon]